VLCPNGVGFPLPPNNNNLCCPVNFVPNTVTGGCCPPGSTVQADGTCVLPPPPRGGCTPGDPNCPNPVPACPVGDPNCPNPGGGCTPNCTRGSVPNPQTGQCCTQPPRGAAPVCNCPGGQKFIGGHCVFVTYSKKTGAKGAASIATTPLGFTLSPCPQQPPSGACPAQYKDNDGECCLPPNQLSSKGVCCLHGSSPQLDGTCKSTCIGGTVNPSTGQCCTQGAAGAPACTCPIPDQVVVNGVCQCPEGRLLVGGTCEFFGHSPPRHQGPNTPTYFPIPVPGGTGIVPGGRGTGDTPKGTGGRGTDDTPKGTITPKTYPPIRIIPPAKKGDGKPPIILKRLPPSKKDPGTNIR
jgi:hypothetical protein